MGPMTRMKINRLMLVAGGTGGHIFPALAFGNWVRQTHPETQVRFLSGNRPLELEIYKASGIHPTVIGMEGSPLGAKGALALSRWGQLGKALWQVAGMIRQWKPDVCFLFGGYLSLPALLVCKMHRIPVIAHEQNARAGKSTLLASRLGVKVLSGWDVCTPLSPRSFVSVGVPVRAFRRVSREEAWKELGLDTLTCLPHPPIVLILAGSIGSSSIRELIETHIAKRAPFEGWTFVLLGVSEKIQKSGQNLFLLPRLWDMEPLYNLADLAITRGGASTLSELIATSIPAVVIPWRKAVEDHQYRNAERFSALGHGVIWDEVECDMDKLSRQLLDLWANKEKILGKGSQDSGEGQNLFFDKPEKICESIWGETLSVVERRGLC